MIHKNHFILLLAALSLSSFSTPAHAFDGKLLINDKELVAHAYSSFNLNERLEKFKRMYGEEGPEKEKLFFGALVVAISRTQSKGTCELDFALEFKKALEEMDLPNDHKSIVLFLTMVRHHNFIDDIFYEIVESAVKTHDHYIVYNHSAKVRSRDLVKGEELATKKELSARDLKSIYKPFRKMTAQSAGCAVEIWKGVSGGISRISLRDAQKTSLARRVNAIALTHEFPISADSKEKILFPTEDGKHETILSPELFGLVEFLREEKVSKKRITLQRYLSILSVAKNDSRPAPASPADLKPNSFSSKRVSKKDGGTRRKSLYYRFTAGQIKQLSQLVKTTTDRMDAKRAEIKITYDAAGDNTETYVLSVMEQFRMAQRMLRKDMAELKFESDSLDKKQFSYEDLITAALETGYINADLVEPMLKYDDLWNPDTPGWKKVTQYIFQVTGISTLFLPAPFNVITSVALIFINSQIQQHTKTTTAEDNANAIF